MSARCPPGTYDKFPDSPNPSCLRHVGPRCPPGTKDQFTEAWPPVCLKKVQLHPRLQGGITKRRKHRKSKKSRKSRKRL